MVTRTNHDHPSRPTKIALRSLLVAAAVSLSLLVMYPTPALAHSMHPSAALTYSCSNKHCYSFIERTIRGQLGSSVAISVTDMTCNGCGEPGFIDNEIWLNGTDTNGAGHYWVEGGYATYTGRFGLYGEYYFWADQRPGGGYYEHPMQVVPAADYGHNATFWIWRTPGWANRFSVQMISWATSWTGLSTNNWMQVLDTDMGMELSGTSGAHAGTAFYASPYYQAVNTYWYPLDGWGVGNDGVYDPLSHQWPTEIYQNGAGFYTYCIC